jgi:hypothetical protein
MFVLPKYVYIFSSYFMFVGPFWLKQMQKKGLIEKKIFLFKKKVLLLLVLFQKSQLLLYY